jgi:hypothetical protein
MQLTQFEPIFCIAEIGVLNCSTCCRPMKLTSIEPDKQDCDLRTFECSKFHVSKILLVKI